MNEYSIYFQCYEAKTNKYIAPVSCNRCVLRAKLYFSENMSTMSRGIALARKASPPRAEDGAERTFQDKLEEIKKRRLQGGEAGRPGRVAQPQAGS